MLDSTGASLWPLLPRSDFYHLFSTGQPEGGRLRGQVTSHYSSVPIPNPSNGLQLALSSEGVSSSRFLFLLKCESLPVPRKAQGAGRVCVSRPPFGRRAHWLPETFLCTFSDPLTLFQADLIAVPDLIPPASVSGPLPSWSLLCYVWLPPRFFMDPGKCHLVRGTLTAVCKQQIQLLQPPGHFLSPPALAFPPPCVSCGCFFI